MENQEKNETTVLPENPEIMVKNPRIGKVRKLEEEVRRQNELEQLRTKRIRKEQGGGRPPAQYQRGTAV